MRATGERPFVAHAALAALRADAGVESCRHEQRLLRQLWRLDHGGAFSSPLRDGGKNLDPSRCLRLEPDEPARPAGGRRMSGRARPVCAPRGAVWLTEHSLFLIVGCGLLLSCCPGPDSKLCPKR